MGNKSNKRLVYIGFSFDHHGKHAGYDLIRNYVDYDKYIDCQKSFNFLKRLRRLPYILRKIYFYIFDNTLWWVELKIIIQSLLNRNKYIFHIIYGENLYKYLGYFRNKNEIILTLHQPVEYFKKNIKYLDYLRRVNRIIVLSRDLEKFLSNKLSTVEIKFIPHGVDIEFFTIEKRKDKYSLLMVGNWLRNFEFASRMFNEIKKRNSKVNITVVTNKENFHYFASNSINIVSGISDNQLLKYYQDTNILFLPLYEYTANNALLEALSCGCQVIIATDAQVDSSYIIRDTPTITKFNIEKVYLLIDDMLNSSSIKKANQIRKIAVDNYSWAKIGYDTYAFITK